MAYESVISEWFRSVPGAKSVKGALRVEAVKNQDSMIILMDLLKSSKLQVDIETLIEEIIKRAGFKPEEDKWKAVCIDQLRNTYKDIFKEDIRDKLNKLTYEQTLSKSITSIYQKTNIVEIKNWVLGTGYAIKSLGVAELIEEACKQGKLTKTETGYTFKDTLEFTTCQMLQNYDSEHYHDEYVAIHKLFASPEFVFSNIIDDYGDVYLKDLDSKERAIIKSNLYGSIKISGYTVKEWMAKNYPTHKLNRIMNFSENRTLLPIE